MNIPKIDPSVFHVSLGQLRRAQAADLSQRTYVVNDNGGPLAVCVPWDTFLAMQTALEAPELVGARMKAAWESPTQAPKQESPSMAGQPLRSA